MDIGTAKPTPAERAEVPHHLIDLVSPDEDFTLRRFQRAAREAVADIEGPGPTSPAGGRHRVVRAGDRRRPGHPRSLSPRPCRLGGARRPRRRCTRSCEASILSQPDGSNPATGDGSSGRSRSFTARTGRSPRTAPAWRTIRETDWDLVAVDVERDELSRRIRARFEDQLARGLLDEVRALRDHRPPLGRTAGQALGYRQLLDHLAGRCTLEEAVEAAISATRRFARRQRAWFRRDPRMSWLPANTDGQRERLADDLVARWESRGSDLGVDMRDSKA